MCTRTRRYEEVQPLIESICCQRKTINLDKQGGANTSVHVGDEGSKVNDR